MQTFNGGRWTERPSQLSPPLREYLCLFQPRVSFSGFPLPPLPFFFPLSSALPLPSSRVHILLLAPLRSVGFWERSYLSAVCIWDEEGVLICHRWFSGALFFKMPSSFPRFPRIFHPIARFISARPLQLEGPLSPPARLRFFSTFSGGHVVCQW